MAAVKEDEWSQLLTRVFGAEGELDPNDISRWVDAPFQFAASPPWGLRQRSGGPCGILAAVQGFVLYKLAFGSDLTQAELDWAPSGPARTAAKAAFAAGGGSADFRGDCTAALYHAIAFTCWQARGDGPARILEVAGGQPLTPTTPASALRVHSFDSFPALEAFVGSAAMAAAWASPSGVLQLLLSLILSRGLAVVAADMDEPGPLIARFGHCTQELLNLILLGVAHSGAFDGETDCGGLILRGVPKQPIVGYLSTVEALRYLQVGDRYKNPLVPIFVVGSESHMTVLFSLDPSACDETPSAPLLRIFKRFDVHDNGFVETSALAPILKEAGLAGIADDPAALASLTRTLDSMGANVITWSELWMTVAPLMNGGTAAPSAAAASAYSSSVAPSIWPMGSASATYSPTLSSSSSSSYGAAYRPHSSSLFTAGFVSADALRAAFESCDVEKRGFLETKDLQTVLLAAGVPLEEINNSLPTLNSFFAGSDGIMLIDDLLQHASDAGLVGSQDEIPALIPALIPARVEGAAAAASQSAAFPLYASAAAGAAAAVDSSEATPNRVKRGRPNSRAPGPSSSSAALSPPPASSSGVFTPIDLSQFMGVLAAPSQASSSSSAAAAAAAPAAAAPLLLTNTAASSSSSSSFPSSSSAFGPLPPPSTSAGAGHSSSMYEPVVAARTIELLHFNGMEDRGRTARLTKLTLRQSDSGASALGGGSNSMMMMDTSSFAAAAQAGMGVEEATQRAIELSTAAEAPRNTAFAGGLSALASAATAGAGSSGGSMHIDDGPRTLLGVLRTKFPGASITYEGPPPSLD